MKFHRHVNQIGEWLFRLTLLNLLWIGFTLLGLGFLGLFPATSAVFAVVRQYQIGHKKVSLAKEFIHYYRQDFVKANVLGYSYLLMIAISWIDYRYLLNTQNYWLVSISMVFLIATFIIILAGFIGFSMSVHYELPLIKTILNPFRFMICHMRRTCVSVLLFTVWFMFMKQLPGVIPFLSVSVVVYIIQRVVMPVLMPDESKGKVKQSFYNMNQDDMLYY